MNEGSPRILVAGLGNIFLGDDAFGVEVARRLLQAPPPGDVRVVDFGIAGIDLIYSLLDGYDLVILIDAVARGEGPGTLYVIEPEMPDDGQNNTSVTEMLDPHDMDPAKVLRMVTSLGGRVGRVLLVGCEPTPMDEHADMSDGLSEPVRNAVEHAVELTMRLVADAHKDDGRTLSACTVAGDPAALAQPMSAGLKEANQ